MSNSVRPHRRQPTRLLCPWNSPGKNTGVGCHFLLQYMHVKSESEVAQLCSSLSDPMDCSQPGSSIRGIFQARVLEWGAIAFSLYHARQLQLHTRSNSHGKILNQIETRSLLHFKRNPLTAPKSLVWWVKICRQGDLEVSPQSRQEMPSSGPGSGDANREVDRLERLGHVLTVGRRKRE